jgi:hypothetical protein
MSPDRSPDSPRETIVEALEHVYASSVTYWRSFDAASFLTPIGDAWSPGDNVRHLSKSIRAVTGGLGQPRLLLRSLFGRVKHTPRSMEQIRVTYEELLAAGGNAGRFAPSPLTDVADADAEQARILSAHEASVSEIKKAIRQWREQDLDRYQLPHPLLGRLTVREMLLFTVLHNQHHVDVVKRRWAALRA